MKHFEFIPRTSLKRRLWDAELQHVRKSTRLCITFSGILLVTWKLFSTWFMGRSKQTASQEPHAK